MPIRPENRARYPKDWKAISLRIRRERAEGRCECTGECGAVEHDGRCDAWNGARHPITDSIVVLTVAHLGLPAELPLFLHVTGNAVADEVVQLIGFLMPLDAKGPEWRSMMHDRAATQLRRCSSADVARFLVSFPGGASSAPPTRPVILGSEPAAPIWISLTAWCLLREPIEAANIPAEATAFSDIKTAHAEAVSAALASGLSQAALRSAHCLVATGRRASLSTVGSLLRREIDPQVADNAGGFCDAFPWSGHATLYHMDEYPENCADDNLKAMCQRCHNRYDMPMRRAGIARRKREALQMQELPL